MYQIKKKIISDNIDLYIINVLHMDKELTNFIDKRICAICEGNSGSKLTIVKSRIQNFLERKKKSNLLQGAIAEFFIHLFITDLGFKQECLFLNLEENSIKKGFDGYYSFNSNEWIMESKSGLKSSNSPKHKSKIKEAYEDLSDKVSGHTKNNPWRNAYNHACHRDVNTDFSILSHIKKFTDDFDEKKYYNITDFNIIPSSTIFLQKSLIVENDKQIETDIREFLEEVEVKNALILCTTQKSLQLFIDYLNT